MPQPKKALAVQLAGSLLNEFASHYYLESVQGYRYPERTAVFYIYLPYNSRWDYLEIWRMAQNEVVKMHKRFEGTPTGHMCSALLSKIQYINGSPCIELDEFGLAKAAIPQDALYMYQCEYMYPAAKSD